MANPVPGKSVTTAFGKRGKHWSCKKTSAGGIHTGVDFAAPSGTKIVAPIAGTIRHRNYGSAFGRHQFAISPSKGQPFAKGEVFFAHTRTRLKDGTKVKIGDKIAEVGAEGNVTGAHLHMEYMPSTKGKWNCYVHANPKPIIDAKAPAAPSTGPTALLSNLKYGKMDKASVRHLQRALNAEAKARGGQTVKVTGNYLKATDREVRLCQKKHGFGLDPVGKSFVGKKQATHLFKGTGVTVK